MNPVVANQSIQLADACNATQLCALNTTVSIEKCQEIVAKCYAMVHSLTQKQAFPAEGAAQLPPVQKALTSLKTSPPVKSKPAMSAAEKWIASTLLKGYVAVIGWGGYHAVRRLIPPMNHRFDFIHGN